MPSGCPRTKTPMLFHPRSGKINRRGLKSPGPSCGGLGRGKALNVRETHRKGSEAASGSYGWGSEASWKYSRERKVLSEIKLIQGLNGRI